jgi:hypothetical protein
MIVNEIVSIGWLLNCDNSVCLSICTNAQLHGIFVTISKKEFNGVGGIDGLKNNKQLVVDFYQKYGVGRP